MCNKTISIGILGYGRFGKLLHKILSQALPHGLIKLYSPNNSSEKHFDSLNDVCSCDYILPAVPIAAFEEVLVKICPLLKPGSVLIDVCSVKLHTRKCIDKYLPDNIFALGTHPMFGPGTYESCLRKNPEQPLKDLPLVVDVIRIEKDRYASILEFFGSLGLKVIEMNADQHDRLTAQFQFLSLTTASILKKLDIKKTPISTPSSEALLSFSKMVTVDESLVKDLFLYNPYCKARLSEIEKAFKSFLDFLNE